MKAYRRNYRGGEKLSFHFFLYAGYTLLTHVWYRLAVWVYITSDTQHYVHTSGAYKVTFDMTEQMKSHNFGVNLAYVPHVCTYYFSFFRAIGTYPYVFGAHKNFWSDVWYKRYMISNVSTPRNFCVRNFGRFSLEKLDIFGQKFRPTWNIS